MNQEFLDILESNRKGLGVGIYSVCSANRLVLEASMMQAREDDSLLLIEATSNQVDQFGGYTGMTPQDFRAFVQKIAVEMHFPWEKILLGGDHLGPNVWQGQPAEEAMENAKVQVEAYIDAGFRKIHLDTSMPLAGDCLPLDKEISAERAATLCAVAEVSHKKDPAERSPPLYVIGTEVPVPGGAQEKLETLQPTTASDVRATLEVTQKAFAEKGLAEAWERVIAVVVQPGVEFSNDCVVVYSRERARELSAFIETVPRIVFEAHSTDYQTETALTELVEDHFAILKVGPWLTYALREAVFALAMMEEEWIGHRKDVKFSQIIEVLDREMLDRPEHWQKHYRGEKTQQAFARRYSYSDRIRYYWSNSRVQEALRQLINNLKEFGIPNSLVSQFMPNQYTAIRKRELTQDPLDLIHHKIMGVLRLYARASGCCDTSA